MDDGDTSWASATTIATTTDNVTIDMFPCSYTRGRYQYIQTLLHDYSNYNTPNPENYGFAYREGTLIQSDFALLRPVTSIVQLSDFTTRQTLCVSL